MTDVPHLDVRDCDGSTLVFSVVGRTENETRYLVTVDVGWARASAEVSTYLYGAPISI
ncbi:MAG: hypothetical protein WDO56_30755 [Gammaproteobacteria bacterium]